MARIHTAKTEKKSEPQYVEQEINLSLINGKLNHIIALLSKKSSSGNSKIEDDDEDEED